MKHWLMATVALYGIGLSLVELEQLGLLPAGSTDLPPAVTTQTPDPSAGSWATNRVDTITGVVLQLPLSAGRPIRVLL
jgi:hypothetical protein